MWNICWCGLSKWICSVHSWICLLLVLLYGFWFVLIETRDRFQMKAKIWYFLLCPHWLRKSHSMLTMMSTWRWHQIFFYASIFRLDEIVFSFIWFLTVSTVYNCKKFHQHFKFDWENEIPSLCSLLRDHNILANSFLRKQNKKTCIPWDNDRKVIPDTLAGSFHMTDRWNYAS